MKGEESSGPELEQGLELEQGVEKNTSVLQPKYMAEQLEAERELSKGNQRCWETQWQEFLKTLQSTPTRWETSVIPERAPWEDTKAFLASFEQVAQACQWPREEWVTRLLPALSGEAEQACRSLEARDWGDYEKVKAAILRGDALRMELQRQHFRQFCCQGVEDPRRIYSQLQELCHRWLKPERRSKEQILELLILEQFLASLPSDLQGWIRAGGPDTCSQAVALVEDFLLNQEDDVRAKWKGPVKDEPLGSLDAEEEPSDTAEGVTHRASKQNGDVLGSAVKCPNHVNSLLSDEALGTSPSGMKEEPLDHGENSLSFQMVEKNLIQPSQGMVVWHFLEEDAGNVDLLGNGKGSHVKTENSQCEGNEPAHPTSTASQMHQGAVMEIAERYKRGWKSSKEQEKHLAKIQKECNELAADLTVVISQTCEINNRDEVPLLSKCGRKPCFRLDPDRLHNRGDHSECLLMEESLQQNPYTDKQQRRITGERISEFSENEKESNLDKCQSSQTEAKLHNVFECGKKFSYIDSQSRNQGIQNEGSPYEHCLCRKCCSERELFRSHQQPHTGTTRHECLECGKLFTSRQILVGHQRIHTGERRCKCAECGKSFCRGEHLKKHQRIHTGQKPYKCSQCQKSFSQSESLKTHQRIHTGEKPYKCSQCGKNFRQSEHLKIHQRIHTGEKPCICPECGKCFTERGGLKKHRRIHTGEKPYKCPECGKCFIESGALKKHHRIHTGEKPYKCLQCGESFSQSGLLKSHQIIHTGGN